MPRNYDGFYQGVQRIDRIVKRAEDHMAKRAKQYAEDHKGDSFIYTMASGAGFGAAYMQSIRIFMEMQWISSAAIHTGEYFHGPFEITDGEIPFLIQLSEGRTRPLDERALSFLEKYTARVEVLDAKELGLSTIDTSMVDYSRIETKPKWFCLRGEQPCAAKRPILAQYSNGALRYRALPDASKPLRF